MSEKCEKMIQIIAIVGGILSVISIVVILIYSNMQGGENIQGFQIIMWAFSVLVFWGLYFLFSIILERLCKVKSDTVTVSENKESDINSPENKNRENNSIFRFSLLLSIIQTLVLSIVFFNYNDTLSREFKTPSDVISPLGIIAGMLFLFFVIHLFLLWTRIKTVESMKKVMGVNNTTKENTDSQSNKTPKDKELIEKEIIQKRNIHVAKKMKESGMSADFISQIVGLGEEEISQI